MKHKDSSTDGKVIASAIIEIEKFEDGTIRPKIGNNKMAYYEILGMIELIKIELAEKSWAKANEIREIKR